MAANQRQRKNIQPGKIQGWTPESPQPESVGAGTPGPSPGRLPTMTDMKTDTGSRAVDGKARKAEPTDGGIGMLMMNDMTGAVEAEIRMMNSITGSAEKRAVTVTDTTGTDMRTVMTDVKDQTIMAMAPASAAGPGRERWQNTAARCRSKTGMLIFSLIFLCMLYYVYAYFSSHPHLTL